MYGLTHACFGLALAVLLRVPVVTAVLASLLPDLDAMFEFGFPFVHRGVLHSPSAGLFLAGIVFLLSGRQATAGGFLAGFFSHLFLDTFTPSGIMWLFPWDGYFSLMMATASSLSANVALMLVSLGFFLGWRNRTRLERWIMILRDWF
jgi:inner membrane protein